MNNIFSDLLNICVVIYLDDILIYLNNMSKHHWYIKEVLKHLYKASLYAKAEKYKFHSKLVEYLEYILFFSGFISGAVHTGVEVYRINLEMSGLVEQPWL